MMGLHRLLLAVVALFAQIGSSSDVVYIEDIEEFAILPLCVASALSSAVGYQTQSYGDCRNGRDEVTNLQKCICSDTDLLHEVSTSIVDEVSYSCGKSASADRISASFVFEKYCNPKFQVAFVTPTGAEIVNSYITDFPEMKMLAPCASSALAEAVMNESRCPSQASLYGPCVCGKPIAVSAIETSITREVQSSCSNSADISSAFDFHYQYCDLVRGGSKDFEGFSTPESPPGDMSYYITALSQYGVLPSCAQTALSSVVQGQSKWRCPQGPQALGSCVCLKTEMSYSVRIDLTSKAEELCGSSATDDISSASDVWDFYCSAVDDLAVAEVTESLIQTWPTEVGRTGAGSPNPLETGDGSDNSDDGGGSGMNRTAVIAGSVVGGVLVIFIIIGIAVFIRRRKQRTKPAELASEPPEYRGAPELYADNTGVGFSENGSPKPAVEMPHEERPSELQAQSEADQYIPFHEPQEMDGTVEKKSDKTL